MKNIKRMSKKGPNEAIPILNGISYLLGGTSFAIGDLVANSGAAIGGSFANLGGTLSTSMASKKGMGGVAGGGPAPYY